MKHNRRRHSRFSIVTFTAFPTAQCTAICPKYNKRKIVHNHTSTMGRWCGRVCASQTIYLFKNLYCFLVLPIVSQMVCVVIVRYDDQRRTFFASFLHSEGIDNGRAGSVTSCAITTLTQQKWNANEFSDFFFIFRTWGEERSLDKWMNANAIWAHKHLPDTIHKKWSWTLTICRTREIDVQDLMYVSRRHRDNVIKRTRNSNWGTCPLCAHNGNRRHAGMRSKSLSLDVIRLAVNPIRNLCAEPHTKSLLEYSSSSTHYTSVFLLFHSFSETDEEHSTLRPMWALPWYMFHQIVAGFSQRKPWQDLVRPFLF